MNNGLLNFGFERKSGILLPVSSLPSRYGIGSLGKPCFSFIDYLVRCGQKCWQVLPLNPTAYCDSPYQSPSSFAGNPYFIDLDELIKKGLLKKSEVRLDDSDKIDYGALFSERFKVLRLAYSRFDKNDAFKSFCKENDFWLKDYALFSALKIRFLYKPFSEWDDEFKNHESAVRHEDELREDSEFFMWLQFEFFSEWEKVRAYANVKGIEIIGDMPIYVAYDSADVWAHPELFLLDQNLVPTEVAGCPPDAYAEDGQLWGNPIYDKSALEKDGFSWWISRISHALRLYDILRIDHFRGFAGFYSIPFGEKTARNGKWNVGFGDKLFSLVKENIKGAKIIAEDLGFITPDVRAMLKKFGFPGMKMLQFAFFEPENEYLPRKYETENCVVYTATHDSDCTASWVKTLKGEDLERFDKECEKHGGTRTEDLIRLAMSSKANLVVIPVSDWLGYENDTGRINVPSVADGNWTFRLRKQALTPKLAKKIREITSEYGRNTK